MRDVCEREIRVSQADVLTDQTARQILGHNRARVGLCKQSVPSQGYTMCSCSLPRFEVGSLIAAESTI